MVHALREVDAAFPRGRLSVVAGPSGSGKYSLLRTLAGLEDARSGSVEVDGVDLARLRPGARRRLRRRVMGVVLQDPADNLVEYLRADEQLQLAARLRGTKVDAAAVGSPAVLLADEPTAELDAAAGAALVEAMRGLAGRGATLIVSSHDAAVIEAADHVVSLRDGMVVA